MSEFYVWVVDCPVVIFFVFMCVHQINDGKE